MKEKKDYTDHVAQLHGRIGDYAGYLLSDVYLHQTIPYLFNTPAELLPAASALASIPSLYYVTMGTKELVFVFSKYVNQTRSFKDFSISQSQFIYRGDDISLKERTLTKNEEIDLIKFDNVSRNYLLELINKFPQEWREEKRQNLLQVLEEKKDDKIISIYSENLERDLPNRILRSGIKIQNEELFKNKQVKLLNKQAGQLLFTKEILLESLKSDSEVFLEKIELLNDEILDTYIETVRSNPTKENYIRTKHLLEKRLKGLIAEELAITLETTELTIENKNQSLHPVKQKTNSSISVLQNHQLELIVRKINQKGKITDKKLATLLPEIENSEINFDLDPQARVKLAYQIYETLRLVEDISCLIEQDESLGFDKQKDFKINGAVEPFLINHLATLGQSLRLMRRRLNPILFAFFCYSSIQPVYTFTKELPEVWASSPLNFGKPSDKFNDEGRKREFLNINRPGGFPKNEVVWQVESIGPNPISPVGYYTEGLASDLTFKGEWELETRINKEDNGKERIYNRSDITSFEDYLSKNEEQNFLLLTRKLNINRLTPTTLKIPIKDGTAPVAMSVVDNEGNSLDYEVLELMDISAQLIIPPSGSINNEVVIKTVLERSSYPIFKARYNAVEQLIFKEQLNDKVLADLEAVRNISRIPIPIFLPRTGFLDTPDFTNFTKLDVNTFKYIQERFRYSISSQKRGEVPSDVMNNIANSEICECTLCNTYATLLYGIADQGYASRVNPINLAQGYLNTSDSRISFLRKDRAHAYAIDARGNILDATPTNMADDEITKQYLEQLAKPIETQSSAQSKNDLDPKGLLWAGGTLGLMGLVFLGRALSKKVRIPEVDKVDKLVTKILGQKDLEELGEKALWLSWGDKSKDYLNTEAMKDKDLRFLRENSSVEKINKSKKLKLKLLAEYIKRSR